MFGKFATFLFEDKIGWQTSMSYLSSIKRQLEKTHKTDIFQKDPKWYTSLRKVLHKKYVEWSLQTGKKLKEQAPAMTTEDLLLIGKALFHKNTKAASTDRMLINQQWLSIGRSSDVGAIRYDDLQWMGTHILVDMTRLKTRRQQKIAIFCSCGTWEVDPFHSLACVLISDKYSTSDRLFDQISIGLEEKKVAAYINRLLQCVAIYVKEGQLGTVTPNLQSHSTRRGSAVVAASNPNISIADVGNRGQWTLDSFSTVFEYICSTRANDQKVAKVLGGWSDPSHAGFPPTLYALLEAGPSETKQKAKDFASAVYINYFSKVQSEGFKEVLLASVLMYLDETYSFFKNHKLHQTLIDIGKYSVT